MSALPTTTHLNADFVTPQLLVGGDLHPDDGHALLQIAELTGLGVRDVLDARVEWSDEAFLRAHAQEIRYHHVGIDDAGQRVPSGWFDDAVSRAQMGLREGAVIYSHCHAGINRGPSLAFAVLLAEGWDLVDALTQIRRRRPIAGMAYAEDALAWHHGRTGADAERVEDDRIRLAMWRSLFPLDVVRAIRSHHVRHDADWGRVTSSRYLAG